MIIIVGCSTNSAVNTAVNEIKINSFSESNLTINNIRFIDLEFTGSQNYFANISNVVPYKDQYLVVDCYSKKVLLFDKDGSFVATVGLRGRSNTEYVDVHDVCVDSSGSIFVFDGSQKKIVQYSPEFNHVRSITVPFSIENLACTDNGFLISLAPYNSDNNTTPYRLITADRDGNVISRLVKYEYSTDQNYQMPHFISDCQRDLNYNRAADDSIYLVSKKGEIKEVWVVDFEGDRVPNDLKNNLAELDKGSFLTHYSFINKGQAVLGVNENGESYTVYLDIAKQKKVKVFYDGEQTENDIFKFPCFATGNTVTTSINSETFPGYQGSAILPESTKKHLSDDNTTLCIIEYTID